MTHNKQAYNITKCSNSRDLDFYKNEPLVARQHSLSGETSRSESNLVTSPTNHRRTNEIKGAYCWGQPFAVWWDCWLFYTSTSELKIIIERPERESNTCPRVGYATCERPPYFLQGFPLHSTSHRKIQLLELILIRPSKHPSIPVRFQVLWQRRVWRRLFSGMLAV
jgi:hypothetical protein